MENIKPELVKIKGFTVEGLSIRTSNLLEMNILTAQIPNLWADFASNVYNNLIVKKNIASPLVYGVYYDFDGDVNSPYNLMAGVEKQEDSKGRLETVDIEEGTYLVFKNQGQMPAAVISTWFRIWDYFKQSGLEYERTYKTDFEKYSSVDSVEVYVGVKKV